MAANPGLLSDRMPGRPVAAALLVAARRRLREEFAGTPPHRWLLAHGRPQGLSAMPRDLRPASLSAGRQILAGVFLLGGETMAPGRGGDPWDRPCPSRRFAVALHRFGWMRDLLATGPEGAAEGLRLALEWSRTFGRWNGFAWSAEVLERRVFNLACAIRSLAVRASDAEAERLTHDLARQARFLLQIEDGPVRLAERAAAAGLAGAALSGPAGERLLARSLARLRKALPAAVLDDGGHATRNPQAALELFFDLSALDDALVQRGESPPEALSRALDRLAAAVRFFTLADGRLAGFHGGEVLDRAYVAAARAQDEFDGRSIPAALGGYQRLEGRTLQVLADAAPAPAGPWSIAACAQPLALEVLTAGRRLIVGGGWSPDVQGPQAMRLVDAASTASLGDAACGEPLRGFAAKVLGPQLAGAARNVEARRHETPGGRWLEMAHDGWVERFGLRHERRLHLDLASEELRGEDRFGPVGRKAGPRARRFVPVMVRFHLDPEVKAQVARDGKSVLLRTEGDDRGWWLRSDAVEVQLEPSIYYEHGQARRAQQVVLRAQVRIADGGKVRWKLSPAARVDAAQPAA